MPAYSVCRDGQAGTCCPDFDAEQRRCIHEVPCDAVTVRHQGNRSLVLAQHNLCPGDNMHVVFFLPGDFILDRQIDPNETL